MSNAWMIMHGNIWTDISRYCTKNCFGFANHVVQSCSIHFHLPHSIVKHDGSKLHGNPHRRSAHHLRVSGQQQFVVCADQQCSVEVQWARCHSEHAMEKQFSLYYLCWLPNLVSWHNMQEHNLCCMFFCTVLLLITVLQFCWNSKVVALLRPHSSSEMESHTVTMFIASIVLWKSS